MLSNYSYFIHGFIQVVLSYILIYSSVNNMFYDCQHVSLKNLQTAEYLTRQVLITSIQKRGFHSLLTEVWSPYMSYLLFHSSLIIRAGKWPRKATKIYYRYDIWYNKSLWKTRFCCSLNTVALGTALITTTIYLQPPAGFSLYLCLTLVQIIIQERSFKFSER